MLRIVLDMHKLINFVISACSNYLYHGTTEFKGMNDGKPLIIKKREEVAINGMTSYQFVEKNIFPEYYLIRVEKYQNIVKKRIDEWIYMIKNNEVKEGSQAKNIDKAAEKLTVLNMNEKERKAYEDYLVGLEREKDILETSREEGEKIGLQKGERKKAEETACKLKQMGVLTNEQIAEATGLTLEQVESLVC